MYDEKVYFVMIEYALPYDIEISEAFTNKETAELCMKTAKERYPHRNVWMIERPLNNLKPLGYRREILKENV